MELEALQEIHSEVRALGAQIVVMTPELERYRRALHKKLNLTFDIPDRSSSEDGRAVRARVYAAGLLAGALQVLREHLGQVPR
jgi:peroxiredoxin